MCGFVCSSLRCVTRLAALWRACTALPIVYTNNNNDNNNNDNTRNTSVNTSNTNNNTTNNNTNNSNNNNSNNSGSAVARLHRAPRVDGDHLFAGEEVTP